MSRPTKNTIEKRTVFVSELRADSQGDEMALVGYACSFNCLSQDLGGWFETIAPGAFSRSLAAGDDVHCLINHDPSKILGRKKSGTLTVEEDSRGLKFRCALNPASQMHRDFHSAIKRGDIDQCSFAFRAMDGDGDEWGEDTDERGQRFIKRTLRNVTLMDVSAVTYPAYDAPGSTTVAARTLPQYGAAEFDKHVRRRAEELRQIIARDGANATLREHSNRLYAEIDAMNLSEAARIGAQILADDNALRARSESENELQRKMQILNGRLVR